MLCINIMIQHQVFIRNLLQKALNDGIENRCIMVEVRNQYAVAEVRECSTLQGPVSKETLHHSTTGLDQQNHDKRTMEMIGASF